MRKIDIARLMQDASGTWFGYLPPFLALTPIWIVISIFQLPQSSRPEIFLPAIGANISSLALCAGVLCCFRILNHKLFVNVPTRIHSYIALRFWAVVAVGAIIGFLKAVGTSAFLAIYISSNTAWEDIAQRIAANVLVGMWTIPAFAIILATLERYRREKQALMTELVAQSVNNANRADSTYFSEPETNKYLSRLTELRHELTHQVSLSPSDSHSISRIFSELASGGVRSLSHDIWREENTRFTNFSLLDLAQVTIRRNHYPVFSIAVSWAVVTFPVLVLNFPALHAVGQALLQLLLVVCVYAVANLISTSRFLTGLVSFLATVVITAALVFFTSFLVPPSLDALANLVIIVSFFIFVPLTFAMAVTAYHDRGLIESELSAILNENERERIHLGSHAIQDRQLAYYLHGHIQSHLMATALRLSQHNTLLQPHEIEHELEQIDQLFDAAQRVNFSSTVSALTVEQIRHTICSEWAGLAQVEIIFEDQDISPETCGVISHVLTEALSNAVRHGMATQVRCEVSTGCITVTDNGTGPRNGKAGLGSMYFTSLCQNEPWKLEAQPEGGSVLWVPLPRN